mmetsp:Transcript_149696/g.279108  ORF Transcript_149696/g.279108 Transcript_149696/m.279108 type:complete len:109 (-) Transcript_149696:293-619(-)
MVGTRRFTLAMQLRPVPTISQLPQGVLMIDAVKIIPSLMQVTLQASPILWGSFLRRSMPVRSTLLLVIRTQLALQMWPMVLLHMQQAAIRLAAMQQVVMRQGAIRRAT